jgi:hypothetical protein
MKLLLTALALTLGTAASAATINTVDGPVTGKALALNLADFTGSGPCGDGISVINDGCSPVIKDSTSARPSGRFNPLDPNGSWVDSSDLEHLEWNVNFGQKAKALIFALTDADDQPARPQVGLGESHFSVSADGGTLWSIAKRAADRNVQWLAVVFDTPQTGVTISFDTRHDDGFGVSNPIIAAVPVPAAGLLLLSGIAGLAGFRRLRSGA